MLSAIGRLFPASLSSSPPPSLPRTWSLFGKMRQIHAPGRREAQAKKKLGAEARNVRSQVFSGVDQLRRCGLIAANSNDDDSNTDKYNDDWGDEDGGAVSSPRLWYFRHMSFATLTSSLLGSGAVVSVWVNFIPSLFALLSLLSALPPLLDLYLIITLSINSGLYVPCCHIVLLLYLYCSRLYPPSRGLIIIVFAKDQGVITSKPPRGSFGPNAGSDRQAGKLLPPLLTLYFFFWGGGSTDEEARSCVYSVAPPFAGERA